MDRRILIASLLLLASFAATFSILTHGGSNGRSYVDIAGERISAEIADTDQEMQKGLMFRESLCDECGMLFVFRQEGLHSFWMKNTLIPLDMIFIDAKMTVVDVIHAVPCSGEFCESYTPRREALYVLEVNGNKFDEKIIGRKAEINI